MKKHRNLLFRIIFTAIENISVSPYYMSSLSAIASALIRDVKKRAIKPVTLETKMHIQMINRHDSNFTETPVNISVPIKPIFLTYL